MNTIERIEARCEVAAPTSTYIVAAAEWAAIKAVVEAATKHKREYIFGTSQADEDDTRDNLFAALSKLEN